MCARRGTIPDFRTDYPGTDLQANFSEVLIQKAGPERYVLLPYNDQDSLQPGDYYIAVVGEGVNPSDNSRTGTGTSSGVLASNGPLTASPLGTASLSPLTQAVDLAGGQVKAFQFTVPAGTASLEVRLDNPDGHSNQVGHPWLSLVNSSRIAQPRNPQNYEYQNSNSYGFGGGQYSGRFTHPSIITVPKPGPWLLQRDRLRQLGRPSQLSRCERKPGDCCEFPGTTGL